MSDSFSFEDNFLWLKCFSHLLALYWHLQYYTFYFLIHICDLSRVEMIGFIAFVTFVSFGIISTLRFWQFSYTFHNLCPWLYDLPCLYICILSKSKLIREFLGILTDVFISTFINHSVVRILFLQPLSLLGHVLFQSLPSKSHIWNFSKWLAFQTFPFLKCWVPA